MVWCLRHKLVPREDDKEDRNEIKDIMMHWDQPMDEFLFLVNIYQDNLHQDKIDQLQFGKL